jgi:hypothetical protein
MKDYENLDICDRLYNSVPYGLDDHNLLIDARKEILKLRKQQTTRKVIMISKDESIVTQVAAKIASELTAITLTGDMDSIQSAYLGHFDFVRELLRDAHGWGGSETQQVAQPVTQPTPWVVQANEQNTVTQFNAGYESAGSTLKVAGIQHGPLPAWLIQACAKAGVTSVFDNRDTATEQNRRPLFKAADGKLSPKGQPLAFWAPKG